MCVMCVVGDGYTGYDLCTVIMASVQCARDVHHVYFYDIFGACIVFIVHVSRLTPNRAAEAHHKVLPQPPRNHRAGGRAQIKIGRKTSRDHCACTCAQVKCAGAMRGCAGAVAKGMHRVYSACVLPRSPPPPIGSQFDVQIFRT